MELDLSDVDHRVGQPIGGGQLWEPCSPSDIRRWVMAMDYPNPMHWDEEFARDSKFGGLVAPQSIPVALDYGHGAAPACVGQIPGSHLIFGGEEWWFYGYPVRPGDKLFQERRFHDYKVADTKFAGPTMFPRGDTIHRNQHGALVARERSTAIRYLAEEATSAACTRTSSARSNAGPKRARRGRQAALRVADSNRHGVRRISMRSRSATRCRAGSSARTASPASRPSTAPSCSTSGAPSTGPRRRGIEDPWVNQDPGWVEGFGFDEEGARIDPRMRDGLYVGPSRGHIDGDKAGEVGMARAYGYGATMGAWCTDYLAYWAGHDGMVRHGKSDFRGPAFEGDVTYFDAEVVDKQEQSAWGVPLVQVKLRLTNQDGGTW